MSVTLLSSAVLSILAAFVLTWLGRVVSSRTGSTRGTQLAGSMFGLWWYALAASTAVSGFADLLVIFADAPLRLRVGLELVNLVAICMGLAGLLFYLVFLYTGRPIWFWPLTIFYALYCGTLLRTLMRWEPVGVAVGAWETSVVYARSASEATTLWLLFLLIGPQLLASLALFALSTRLPASASRVRLLVVATAIFAWFGSTFLAMAFGVSSNPVWEVVALFIPLSVGAGVLLVHRPPPWLERRMPPELAVETVRQGRRPARARR